MEAARRDYAWSSTSADLDGLTNKLKEVEMHRNQLIVRLSKAKIKFSEIDSVRAWQEEQLKELKAENLSLKMRLSGEVEKDTVRELASTISPPVTTPLTSPRVSWAGTGLSTAASTVSTPMTVPSTYLEYLYLCQVLLHLLHPLYIRVPLQRVYHC